MPTYALDSRQFTLSIQLICLFLPGLLSTHAAAAIQHWIDDKGQHHFSDQATADSQEYRPDNSLQKIPATKYPKLTPATSKTTKAAQARKADQRKRAKEQARIDKTCKAYTVKIRRINAKLRHSHSNTQGNRWRQQRREYQQRSYQQCR